MVTRYLREMLFSVRRLVAVAVAASSMACSLVVDLSGLSGSPPAASGDASGDASEEVGDATKPPTAEGGDVTGPDALSSSCSGATLCDDFGASSLATEWSSECSSATGGAFKLESGALVVSSLPSGNTRFCRIRRAVSNLTRFSCVIDWNRTLPAKRDDTYNHAYFSFETKLLDSNADIIWLLPQSFNAGTPNTFGLQEYHTALGFGGSTSFSISSDVTKTERWRFTFDYPAGSLAIARDTASGSVPLGSMALTKLNKPIVGVNVILGIWYREPGPVETTDVLSYDFIRCDALP